MTQVYDAKNVLVPVTVVEPAPAPFVQVKTTATTATTPFRSASPEEVEEHLRRGKTAPAKAA